MVKRFGKVTVANIWLNVGVYVNHTPYRTSLFGFNPFGKWGFGRSNTPGVKAVAVGPFVVGKFDLADVGRSHASV
jgi:hypothetical protein